jgi:hypothetical protein
MFLPLKDPARVLKRGFPAKVEASHQARSSPRHSLQESYPDSVQEQSSFGILYNPCQTFLEICTRNGTTSNNVPFVRSDGI